MFFPDVDHSALHFSGEQVLVAQILVPLFKRWNLIPEDNDVWIKEDDYESGTTLPIEPKEIRGDAEDDRSSEDRESFKKSGI